MESQIILQGLETDELLTSIRSIVKDVILEHSGKIRNNPFAGMKYLTSKQVDQLFSISPTTRYNWEKKGLLTPIVVDRKKLYLNEECEKLAIKKRRI